MGTMDEQPIDDDQSLADERKRLERVKQFERAHRARDMERQDIKRATPKDEGAKPNQPDSN